MVSTIDLLIQISIISSIAISSKHVAWNFPAFPNHLKRELLGFNLEELQETSTPAGHHDEITKMYIALLPKDLTVNWNWSLAMIKCTEYYHPICVYMYIRTYIFAEVSAFSCSITRQNPSAKTTSRTAIVVDHDCIETLSPKMTVAWKASCRSEQSPSLSALAATCEIFHTIRDWNFIPKYLGHHFAPQECKHGSNCHRYK